MVTVVVTVVAVLVVSTMAPRSLRPRHSAVVEREAGEVCEKGGNV